MTKLDWSKADAEAGAGAGDNSRAAMLRRTATAEYVARTISRASGAGLDSSSNAPG